MTARSTVPTSLTATPPAFRRCLPKLWALVLGASLVACVKREGAPEAASGLPASPAEGAATSGAARVASATRVDLLGGQGLGAFGLVGKTERVDLSRVEVVGQPFKEAWRARILERSDNLWEVQLGSKLAAPIHKGDAVLVSFWMRTEATATGVGQAETGTGRTEVSVESTSVPPERALVRAAEAGPEWRELQFPFEAKRDFAAGEAQAVFRLGYSPQTVDFADIRVQNFGTAVALADLPKTRDTYRGREPDAPWRAAADERIDQLRRANLTVEVVDAAGNPVPGAEVHASLQQHEFLFGTCAPAEYVLGQHQGQPPEYNALLGELFNAVTLENDLKWQPLAGDWEPEYTLARATKAVDRAREQGLAVRGHVLVWPGWRNLPKSLKEHEKDPATLRKMTLEHIRELVTAMRGKLTHWDVVNEPFTNHDLLDILGHEEMIAWFKLARKLDPKPKLFINDFAILSGGGGTTAHRDHYEKMIQLLVDGKAPFDGVGLQGHFGSALTAPDDLWALLDRYGRFGKELAVTEYDVAIDDEELAGDFTRDFYTLLFSHPAVSTLFMWGFWDANHWKQNAAMYRADWSLKPGGQAYRDLVLGKWHTDETGQTDGKGKFSARGFKGKYVLEVKAGERTKTQNATLTGKDSVVRVRL